MSDADVSNLPARQIQILELIRSQGYVATEQLVRHFGVSPQSIRRDINTLCDLDLIERFHGGAGRIGNAYNQPYQDRLQEGMDGKRKIARMVAKGDDPTRAAFTMLGKLPEMLGVLGYALGRLSHRRTRLIEYK